MDSNISSCNKSIEQLLTNCPLKQFWGETVFANLDTLNSSYCVDWEGSCADSLIITNADIEFAIDQHTEVIYNNKDFLEMKRLKIN